MHKTIFDHNPNINSSIIAHPPNLMAFNVTEQTLDSKIIPEAYILMRDIKKVSYSTSMLDVDKVSAELSDSSPICMFQNNGIIVTADNMLLAYDRLEVAEFTAKAVLGSFQLGTVNTMDNDVIDELKGAFNLPD